ncbi:MAG: hypothetical protein LBT44_03815 [Clostridiales bacterium]|nr:hypothetical protein [Clostridiales bacterium]
MSAEDYAVFQFTAPYDEFYRIFTDLYNIDTGETLSDETSNDTVLYLYSDAGLTNEIAYNDDKNGTPFLQIQHQLNAGTTYYIKLLSHRVFERGIYTRLTVVRDEMPTPTVITLDESKYVDLPAGDYAVLQFTAAQDGFYKIFTSEYSDNYKNPNDTVLYLYSDAELTNLIAYESGDYDHMVFSQIQYQLNAGTTYYIKLFPWYKGEEGRLHARLTVVLDATPTPTPAPTPIEIRLNESKYVDLPAGDYAVFEFSVSDGSYRIFTGPYDDNGSSNDTVLYLYSDAALTHEIAYNDDSGGTFFSQVSMNLYSSTYYIKLTHYRSFEGVHARLTVVREGGLGLTSPPASTIPDTWTTSTTATTSAPTTSTTATTTAPATATTASTTTTSTPINVINLNESKYVDLPAGQYAVYQFTAPQDGFYRIFTDKYSSNDESSNDTVLYLYSDAELRNEIAYNDDVSGTRFSQIQHQLAAGTTYYIKLKHYSSSTGVHARLSVTASAAATPTPAPTPIPIDVIGLDQPKDVDWSAGQSKIYQFTTDQNAGDYRIFTGPYNGNGPSNDTVLYLYADAALTALIVSNDDYGGTRFSHIQPRLAANTTYYIKVKNYSSLTRLHARLTVTAQAAPTPSPTPTPLPFGNLTEDKSQDIDLPAGQFAVYVFNPQTTGRYKIFTAAQSDGVDSDTVLYLYSNAALTNQIAFNDDYGGKRFSEIQYNMRDDTTYYIKVKHYSTTGSVHATLNATQS